MVLHVFKNQQITLNTPKVCAQKPSADPGTCRELFQRMVVSQDIAAIHQGKIQPFQAITYWKNCYSTVFRRFLTENVLIQERADIRGEKKFLLRRR